MPSQDFFIGKVVPGAVAVLGIALLSLWMQESPEGKVKERIPGTDRAAADKTTEAESPLTKGQLTKFDGTPADIPGAWPYFRGKNLDGISDESVPLARKWGAGGPPALWSLDLGEGHAGAAVLEGRVYLIDYDRERQMDSYRCLSLADGKEIWRFSYPVKVKRNHGMSRTVPAVTAEYVVGIGPKCHVACLDAKTGEFLWGLDLVRDFGTEVPPWYAGQCPIIEDGRVILAPGGDVLMIAVDCRTGEIVWKSPNPRDWRMTHCSITPMEYDGRRTYVYCGSGGVAGISATDGSILWDTTEWKVRIAAIASPVIAGPGKLFLSGGYNAGCMMLGLRTEGESFVPEALYRIEPDMFGATQHTPILHKGYIYGVRPNGELACLSLEGKIKWASGRERRFGLGPQLIADGLLFVLGGDRASDGRLTLVEATPDGYRQLAEAQVLDGHDSWAPMAIANGRLLLRDLTRMACLDVGQK